MTQLFTINNLAAVLTTLLGSYFAFCISKWFGGRDRALSVAERRLYQAYLPLHLAIEPYLDNPPNQPERISLANELVRIQADNYILISPVLMDLTKQFSIDARGGNPSQKSFMAVCRLIERDYESLKRKLHLPARMIYRRAARRDWTGRSPVKSNLAKTVLRYFDLLSDFCLEFSVKLILIIVSLYVFYTVLLFVQQILKAIV